MSQVKVHQRFDSVVLDQDPKVIEHPILVIIHRILDQNEKILDQNRELLSILDTIKMSEFPIKGVKFDP